VNLSSQVKSFTGGAFALIALYLVLAHAGGFSTMFGSVTTGASNVFGTLQGRGAG
jgi:hypothetical protein